MWASHVHDPNLWAGLIAPIRNLRLSKDYPCELTRAQDMAGEKEKKGFVAYHDILREYSEHLNQTFPQHEWPAALSA